MVKVRFAPSPTGYLHLGNIRTALFNFLFAKRNGGKFLLRIEDTDRERSKPEYAKAQMEDLLWLGLKWDEGPEVGGNNGPYYQSERMDIYQKYIDKLIAEDKAYYCYVTEEETEKMKVLAKLEKRPPRFDNRGRDFTSEEIEKRKAAGVRPTVRFKIDNPKCELNDLVRGKVSFNLDDMVGDFVIQRADGNPTFHLVVCIDDCLMGVTHVIRGEDHLSNTPKHLLLIEAMGLTAPQYGHLSLVNGPGGEPLSKRLSSVSVKEFRKKGYLPQALANYISLLGWSPGEDREILQWDELQQLFDVSRVSKSSSNFDPQKLDWVNGEHLRSLSDEEFVTQAMAYLKQENKISLDESVLLKALPAFKDNIERFEQLPDRLAILNEDFPYEDADMIKSDASKEVFAAAISVLPDLKASDEELYQSFINALKPKVSSKGKHLFHPLRMALTGKLNGPELKRIFPVFGVEKAQQRFERALKQA